MSKYGFGDTQPVRHDKDEDAVITAAQQFHSIIVDILNDFAQSVTPSLVVSGPTAVAPTGFIPYSRYSAPGRFWGANNQDLRVQVGVHKGSPGLFMFGGGLSLTLYIDAVRNNDSVSKSVRNKLRDVLQQQTGLKTLIVFPPDGGG